MDVLCFFSEIILVFPLVKGIMSGYGQKYDYHKGRQKDHLDEVFKKNRNIFYSIILLQCKYSWKKQHGTIIDAHAKSREATNQFNSVCIKPSLNEDIKRFLNIDLIELYNNGISFV